MDNMPKLENWDDPWAGEKAFSNAAPDKTVDEFAVNGFMTELGAEWDETHEWTISQKQAAILMEDEARREQEITQRAKNHFAAMLMSEPTEGSFVDGELFIKRKPIENVIINEVGYEAFKVMQEAATEVDRRLGNIPEVSGGATPPKRT